MVKKSRKLMNLFDLTDIERQNLNNSSWLSFSVDYMVLRKKSCGKNQNLIDGEFGIPKNVWLS